MIRDIRYEEIPFYGWFFVRLPRTKTAIPGFFTSRLLETGRFSISFLARNPQLTPKIKDETEIEEIYNIKEELGRGTFGVVNRAEKDGKEGMTFLALCDLQ